MPKRILIVEDKTAYVKGWLPRLVEKGIDSTHATTIEQATQIFNENPSFDLIVMDCCVPGDFPNTMELVAFIRQSFKGPILVNSTCSDFVDMLMKVGASHRAHKSVVAQKVIEILQL